MLDNDRPSETISLLKEGIGRAGHDPVLALQLRHFLGAALFYAFVIAQMLGAAGHPDEALTELEAVRPLLADAFGADSIQVRNLDRQIDRLGSVKEHDLPSGR